MAGTFPILSNFCSFSLSQLMMRKTIFWFFWIREFISGYFARSISSRPSHHFLTDRNLLIKSVSLLKHVSLSFERRRFEAETFPLADSINSRSLLTIDDSVSNSTRDSFKTAIALSTGLIELPCSSGKELIVDVLG